MKAFGVFLIVLCLVALCGVLYLHLTSNLNVIPETCHASRLEELPGVYESLKARLDEGTFVGTRFSDELLSSSGNYILCTWTVRIDNHTSLEARAVEIQVSPKNGYDILQFDPDTLQSGRPSEHIVPPHSSREIYVCVLASGDIGSAFKDPYVREAKVTWYFTGQPFPEGSGNSSKVVLR